MANKTVAIVAAVVVIVVIVLAGYFTYTYYYAPQPAPSPSPTPSSTETQIRQLTMNFIATNHTQASSFITTNMQWTGGMMDSHGMVGYTNYNYLCNGWNVTIGYPVVPNPIYSVTATYTSPSTHQVIVNWSGSYENGVITEESYHYTAP
jgi:hypothetical protein